VVRNRVTSIQAGGIALLCVAFSLSPQPLMYAIASPTRFLMGIVGTIAVCGLLAGLGIGVAMVFLSSANVRVSAESQLLPFGIGGTPFMLAWSVVSTDRASAQVETGIGALVVASLVAGIVLSIARRMKAGA